jgi:cyclopropane fatty-acyl-phospholipid synthase-like methyltransferase
MKYKDELYNQYVTTHINQRKRILDNITLAKTARGLRQHFKQFIKIDKTAKIVDLGCGSGALVWWLLQEGYVNTKGVDGSVEQVALAHKLGINSVCLGNVFDFLDQEENYNIIFARDLIEHFDSQSVYDFILQSNSTLVPGGRLILQVPNAESPYFGRIRYGDFTHEQAFTKSSITQVLRATGYENIKIYPWRTMITGPGSLMRNLAWRIVEPIIKLPIYIEAGDWDRPITINMIVCAEKINDKK